MLSNEIQHLAEQAAQLMRDAAEATAYAQETERRATALARELDDLAHRSRAQQTEIARVVSENVELRHELNRVQAALVGTGQGNARRAKTASSRPAGRVGPPQLGQTCHPQERD